MVVRQKIILCESNKGWIVNFKYKLQWMTVVSHAMRSPQTYVACSECWVNSNNDADWTMYCICLLQSLFFWLTVPLAEQIYMQSCAVHSFQLNCLRFVMEMKVTQLALAIETNGLSVNIVKPFRTYNLTIVNLRGYFIYIPIYIYKCFFKHFRYPYSLLLNNLVNTLCYILFTRELTFLEILASAFGNYNVFFSGGGGCYSRHCCLRFPLVCIFMFMFMFVRISHI